MVEIIAAWGPRC